VPSRVSRVCTKAPRRSRWTEVIRSTRDEFEVSLDEVLHDGDDVLVVADLLGGQGRGSGVEVEMRIFSVYWFEDGQIRRWTDQLGGQLAGQQRRRFDAGWIQRWDRWARRV
jgi:ketosteroid isomerase-like protein